jgi:Mitochondrial distribution and morphology protein 10
VRYVCYPVQVQKKELHSARERGVHTTSSPRLPVCVCPYWDALFLGVTLHNGWEEMHPFATYVLRTYYQATGWSEDNLYANLTRSSHGWYFPNITLQMPLNHH